MPVLSSRHIQEAPWTIRGWSTSRGALKSRTEDMCAILSQRAFETSRGMRWGDQTCCSPKYGKKRRTHPCLWAVRAEVVEGTYKDMGNFILKPQFRTKMLRCFLEIDEEWIWWVLHVGSEKSLRKLLWALWTSGMEEPWAYQLHDKLLLLGGEAKARTCILCVVRLCENSCSASPVP